MINRILVEEQNERRLYMNKFFNKITTAIIGVALAIGIGAAIENDKGAARVGAAETVAYTLTPASGSNNSYSDNCDIEIDNITWNLTGNSQMQPWRIGGGKNTGLSNVNRELYSKTAISDDITKIVVTHGSASSITVNSWTLVVASNADFSTVVSTLTPSFAANSSTTIERPAGKSWANCYYKFIYNVTVTVTSNKFLEFTEAKFYKNDGGGSTTYTVTYDDNGATSGDVPTDGGSYSSGATVTVLGNTGSLAKDHYTFGGWNTNAQGDGTNYSAGATFSISANTTLYAKWNPINRTVTYNANTGEGSEEESGGSYLDGSTVTTEPNSFTYSGHIFDHWCTKKDDSGTKYAEGAEFTISEDTTLYAQWTTEPSGETDTLDRAFTGNTDTSYKNWSNKEGDSGTIYAGTSAGGYTSIQLRNQSPSGIVSTSTIGYVSKIHITWSTYTASGRYVDIYGKNTAYSGPSDLYSNSDSTKGTKIGTITYGTSTVLVVNGEYKYIGLISNNTVYVSEIKIVWTSALTVTYNGNGNTGGSVPTDAEEYSKNATVTVKSYGTLVKTGYYFNGWNTKDDGTGDNYAAGTGTFTITKNTTLYAKWTKNTYTIGGTISGGSLSSTTGVQYEDALDINIVPDTGYKFPSSITSVTMGGSAYTEYTYTADTGRFQIESVTGDVVINATCPSRGTLRTITTTVNDGSYTGASDVYSTETATVTVTADDHYKLPETITVSGASYTYTQSTGVIELSSATDDITISVTCVAKNVATIKPTLTNITADSGNATTVEEGKTVTLKYTPNSGYGLPSSVSVTGADSSSWDQVKGELEITGGTAAEITFSISGAEKELLSISLETTSGSFTLGDTFVIPTVTATFNTGDEDVTSEASASGTCLENGILTTTGTSMTITITYSYKNVPKTASFSATVSALVPSSAKFVKVTSGTVTSGKYLIVNETAGKAFNGGINSTSYDVTNNVVSVSISSSEIAYSAAMDAASFTYDATAGTLKSAAGYYIYRNGTSSGVTATTSTPELSTSITVSNGNATISNVKDTSTMRLRYNNGSGQNRFRYYSSDSVESIQIYKYQDATVKSLKWITAEVKSGTYYQGYSVTSSNFTVTAHYDDGTTSTPTSDITVTNAYLANTGSNAVTLTYGGKSCVKTVTAVANPYDYTGLSWAQGEYNIIDGQQINFSSLGTVTAEYDDGASPSANKPINYCTVAAYTKNGDDYSKATDLSDGGTISSSLHGKYLGVTFTEKGTSFTAYSSAPIYVVEALDDVYEQIDVWSSKATSIKVGDKVVIGAYYATGSTNYELKTENTDKSVFDGGSYTTNPTGTISFRIAAGKNDGQFAFKNGSKYLSWSSGNTLVYSDTLNNNSSWTVTFGGDDGTEATISNASDSTRILQFNYNQGSTRFACYTSSQVKPFFVKSTRTPSGDSFANTDVIGQKVVLEFAAYFNETMDCTDSGSTSNVVSKWSTIAGKFEDWFVDNDKELTDDQLEYALKLFTNAYSEDGGDSLQDMLARYDYIVAKYGVTDFLNANTDRPPVAKSVRINILLSFMSRDFNSSIIIIVLSSVTLLSLGGYFFLRKKKED